jgi:hypothetical protein
MALPAISAARPTGEPAVRRATDTAISQLSLRAGREPEAHGLGRLLVATEFVECTDRLVVEALQLLERRESPADIWLDPAAPAAPEQELQAPKLECFRSQLTQRDANGAAAGVAIAEKHAGDEIVGVVSQPSSHRLEQRVWKTL